MLFVTSMSIALVAFFLFVKVVLVTILALLAGVLSWLAQITSSSLPEITGTIILMVVGALISLASTYIPKFNVTYASWDSEHKYLLQLILITAVALIAGILSWTNVLVFLPPGKDGVLLLIIQWFLALQSNTAAYKLSKPPEAVEIAKAERTV